MASNPQPHPKKTDLRPLPKLIFASRWLQLPLYLGLILAQAVYVFHFWVELVHLLEAVFGSIDECLEQMDGTDADDGSA